MKNTLDILVILGLFTLLVGCGKDCSIDKYADECLGLEEGETKHVDIIVSLDKLSEPAAKNVKAGLGSVLQRFREANSRLTTKMGFVANRFTGPTSYNPNFLARYFASNSTTYSSSGEVISPLEEAYKEFNKLKFIELASPVGILEQALRVEFSFLNTAANVLFIVIAEREDTLTSTSSYVMYSKLSRILTNGNQMKVLLVTPDNLVGINGLENELMLNRNLESVKVASRLSLSEVTSESLSQAIWAETNLLSKE